MFIDKRPNSMPFKHITDSVDKIMVNFICRDTADKMAEFLNNMRDNKKKCYFNFEGGVPEIVNNKKSIENNISSIRDFIKQENERLISAFALSLLNKLNEYYSSFVGNGSLIKLFVFGHFCQIDADFYELKSILKEISEREDPRKKLLRDFPHFSVCPEVRTWKDTIAISVKPIKYVCGLAFRPVKFICCLVSQIFWQGTPEAVVQYKPGIRVERQSLILDWLAADLNS
jgi:hypothetical protein